MSSVYVPSSRGPLSAVVVKPAAPSCVWRDDATVWAASPCTASTAEAGPAAASSGVAPAMGGKSFGRESQMRPQSVSVWLVVDPPPVAAVAERDDVAAEAGAGLEMLGTDDAPADEQPASASETTTVMPIARRFVPAWRRRTVIWPSYRASPDGPGQDRTPSPPSGEILARFRGQPF